MMDSLIDDMDDSFVYEPLGYAEHDFRLLRLFGAHSGEIRCELHHATFHSEPYEALSYVWGSLELVESIEVNGKTLRITDNLHAALHHLRLPHRDRLLWVDAVCINQSEDIERSHQVQRMRMVYQRAQTVVVWLGKATAEIQYLMRKLQGLTGRERDFDVRVQRLSDDRMCNGVRTLMNRSWFSRVWVLQEVANARAIAIHAGRHSIPGNVLSFLPATLDLNLGPHCAAVLDVMSSESSGTTSGANEQKLSTLLLKYQGCEATDERDKIYALQGMCSVDEDIAELLPDYTVPTPQTVAHAARYLLAIGKCSVATVLDFIGTFETITALCLLPELTEDLRPAVVHPEGYKPQSTSQHLKRIDRLSAAQKATLLCVEQALEAKDERPLQTCFSQVVGLNSHDLANSGARVENHRKQNIKLLVFTHAFYTVDTCDHPELEELVDLSFKVGSAQSAFREGIFDTLSITSGVGTDRAISGLRPSIMELNRLLSRAVEEGDTTLVEAFVHAGADVNAQEVQTAGDPLLLAARQRHTKLMRVLLRAGASVDGDPNQAGRETALLTAVGWRDTQMVQMLLEAGANVNHVSSEFRDGLRWEWTALTKASCFGQLDIVQMLISAGAEVNLRGRFIGSPLEVASYDGFFDVLQALLSAGADVNRHSEILPSPLESASNRGNVEMVGLLLNAGADVNAAPVRGAKTPVRAAAQKGHRDIVQMLVDAGAEYDLQAEKTNPWYRWEDIAHRGNGSSGAGH